MSTSSTLFFRFYLKVILCLVLLPLSVFSKTNVKPKPGNWVGILQLNDTVELPVIFMFEAGKIIFVNGEEKIIADEITFEKDSIFIRMPVFDSEFRCRFSKNSLTGFFYNHARKNKNIIPFQAHYGLSISNLAKPNAPSLNITGKYHIIFDDEDPNSKDAVGVFTQNGINLSGTFLTTTGDYRFLFGEIVGGKISLSAFDGSHLFLFKAIVKGDSLINGDFFSGQHYHGTWHGWKEGNAKLLPADSLTFLNPGFDKFDFTFLDENGKNISLTDERFKNKSVIIQLMGSWCPNCMDETKFLSNWYNKNRNNNIEVVALAYERFLDTTIVNNNIRRLKKRFDINYPVLFAGSSDKKEAALTLPMLNRVFAFPTTIFLNKEKRVVKIHTGFSGPATGEEYVKFIEWFENIVNKLE